jgi:hypothetical protein
MNRKLLYLCQVYLLLALLAGTVASLQPYSLLSLLLILMTLASAIWPAKPRWNLTTSVTVIFLAPLVMSALLDSLSGIALTATSILAPVIISPAFYLLDCALKQYAKRPQPVEDKKQGRFVTRLCLSLAGAAIFTLFLATALGNPALFYTGLTIIIYLAVMLGWIFLTTPQQPFTCQAVRKRVIAGENADIIMPVLSHARTTFYVTLSPREDWLRVNPATFILNKEPGEIEVNFKPPLAGNSHPQFLASGIDARGLVQINQNLEPLAINVIPRARYAEWLARKYLDQTITAGIAASNPPLNITVPKIGIEYLDSRTYQAGDQQKNIDWKHSLKLNQLIVKEFTEAGDQAAIIAANLSVADAEAADKLAFNLISIALTLASENIQTGLAVYDTQRVILATGISNPVEILRQTLALTREISISADQVPSRHLDNADITKIRRNITRLKEVPAEAAQRLTGILDFQYRAMETDTRKHPANTALATATKRAPTPAIIFIISGLNHDTEAILINMEKLARRNFTTVRIES